jgi:hypothetical protein
MDWKDIAGKIAGFAPMLASVLTATGVGAPAAAAVAATGALISSALGCENNPDAVSQALITDPNAAVKLAQIEADHGEHIAAITAGTRAAELNAQVQQVQAVNQTMQKEDETRSFSWRDFWGYISGVAFGCVVACVVYLVGVSVYYSKPEMLAAIPSIVGAFATLFGIAATVLGVQSSIETHHEGMAARESAKAGK